jgi:cyclophilin family peptidyl-prolyl cis-trans isomerase
MTKGTIRITFLLLALAPGGLAAGDSSRGVGVSLRVRDQVVRLYSESHALIIGAGEYTNGWPQLSGVQDDVAAVRAELMEHGFDTTVVMNPTHDELLNAFGKFVAKHGQQQDARLLIYFAGHGHTLRTSDGRQLGYIVPVDAPNPNVNRDEFKRLAISMAEFGNLAEEIESKHVLFVFDSCFAGTIFGTTRGVPDEISEKTAQPVRQFITAGDADQRVPDKSIFRSEFVEGLRGEADLNHDGYITGSELGMYLESKVTTYSHRTQTPKSGKLARQNLDKGDFVFAVPSAPAAPHQATPAGAANTTQPAVAPDPRTVELEFWNSIKNETDPEYFKDYLHRYPDGMFASIASVRLRNLTTPPASTNAQPAHASSDAAAKGGNTAAKDTEKPRSRYTDRVAELHTSKGEIDIRFFPDVAPNHVKNFIDLAEKGFYNGTRFHRVIPNFMIQVGDPNTISGDPSSWGAGGSGKNVKAEFNSVHHARGIVSMARSNNPDSASSQFFICVADSGFLDKQYTVFGQVTRGMDVVDQIVSGRRGANDRPFEPVSIESVEIRSATDAERGAAPR